MLVCGRGCDYFTVSQDYSRPCSITQCTSSYSGFVLSSQWSSALALTLPRSTARVTRRMGSSLLKFPLMPHTSHPDSNHRCYCDIAGTGSGHEQTGEALSHHSEGRGRWHPYFQQAESTRVVTLVIDFLRQVTINRLFKFHEQGKG